MCICMDWRNAGKEDKIMWKSKHHIHDIALEKILKGKILSCITHIIMCGYLNPKLLNKDEAILPPST